MRQNERERKRERERETGGGGEREKGASTWRTESTGRRKMCSFVSISVEGGFKKKKKKSVRDES